MAVKVVPLRVVLRICGGESARTKATVNRSPRQAMRVSQRLRGRQAGTGVVVEVEPGDCAGRWVDLDTVVFMLVVCLMLS